AVVTDSTIFIGKIEPKALERASANTKLIYQHNPMASLLVCPLEIENKVIGCIFFSARHEAFDLTAYDIQSIERYVTQ
ncbi:MAG: hypothetical protein GTO41_17385, partial [Burkholderiales bacterium]|nr:hypothetical protein [Burkholderiales bacterium]